jgi:Tfp pilus assembly protein FimT
LQSNNIFFDQIIVERKAMCRASFVQHLRRLAESPVPKLVTAAALSGVLLSLALPAVRAIIEQTRVTGLLSSFGGNFLYARSEAVARSKRIVVCNTADPSLAAPEYTPGSTGWRTGWMIFVDEDGESQRNDGDQLLKVGHTRPTGYSIGQSEKLRWIAYNADSRARFDNSQTSAMFAFASRSGHGSVQRVSADPAGYRHG